MVVQLSIVVGNVDALLGMGFTHIEVHSSVDQGNSFQEVTNSSASAAILSSLAAQNTFEMGGREIRYKLDGGPEVTVDFSDILRYWTPAQVTTRINEVSAGLASVSGQTVRLTSSVTGRASSIEITYNDAYSLGWTPGTKADGRAARIPLVSGTLIYTFTDVAGRGDDRYEWRYSANGVNPISEFSKVVQNQFQPPLDSSSLSVGLAQFYDQTGQPRKTRILVAIDSIPQNINGVLVGGGQPTAVDSDVNGFLQVPLIRGARVKIAIENSSYTREFTVPDQSSFQLLEVMAIATDPFTVQTTPPQLIRRSL